MTGSKENARRRVESWEEMELRHAAERREKLAELIGTMTSEGLQVLADLPIEATDIIAARVAAKHGVKLAVMRGPSRIKALVVARQEAFLVMSRAGLSSLEIGDYCDRDPSTIQHGIHEAHARAAKAKLRVQAAISLAGAA